MRALIAPLLFLVIILLVKLDRKDDALKACEWDKAELQLTVDELYERVED